MKPSPAPRRRPVNVYVARDGNGFMVDIATWIAEAATLTGRDATMHHEGLPTADGAINLVVAPHEFYLLGTHDPGAIRAAARCSIPICTEQPGTPWFRRSLQDCVGSPLVVDINEVGVRALERAGFRTRRLQLGAVPGMDRRSSAAPKPIGARDIDVLFLGGLTEHRAAALASLAPALWDRRSQIRSFPVRRPIVGGEPGVVFGEQKYELLARSTVLVNLHRSDIPSDTDRYFEWARAVEAMANGCVVVTEPSSGHGPLVAGTHFIEADAAGMAATVERVLHDEDLRVDVAAAAHAAVTGPLALSDSVGELLDLVEREQLGVDAAAVTGRERRTARRWQTQADQPPLLPVYTPYRDARRAVYDAFLAEVEHRRSLGRFRSLIEFGDEDHTTVHDSTAWDASAAEVTVVVTLFDYAHTVVDTLESILSSSDVDIEIVVVDDASRDDGADVVQHWARGRPDVALRLIRCAANRGLSAARNLGLEHARSDLVMIMDADNLLYPTCLRRLADALAGDEIAAFSYSTLEAFGAEPGLRSAFGWFVPWLCDAPYIDAQAMFRRRTILGHGGYRVDVDAYGWEDYDLWLKLAAAGEHGVHVPEMLGRYRTHPSSMVSLTNLAADGLRAVLVDRYPDLPWPESG